VRVRHPAAGGVARAVWTYGAKLRTELAEANVSVQPWALLVGTEHSGWIALLDRVCEQLVASAPEAVEKLCRNRLDVAAAKARDEGDGQWFSSTALFTRKSFDAFAHLDPKQFDRKAPKKRADGALIGSSSTPDSYPDNPNPRSWKEL